MEHATPSTSPFTSPPASPPVPTRHLTSPLPIYPDLDSQCTTRAPTPVHVHESSTGLVTGNQVPNRTTLQRFSTFQNAKVGVLARRIHGWSWQAFPIGMGTGAVFVTLSGIKYRFGALAVLERIFFFIALALFILNSTTLFIQAIVYPRQSLRLIKDPVKGIFVPLIVLSFATLIIGSTIYAVPAHIPSWVIYELFWVYVGFAVLVCFPMLMIWFNRPHDLRTFTPAWAFLVFPMMLVGVVAFNVLNVMDRNDERAIGILLTGYFFQGLGFFVTLFYICIYLVRVMTTGFLDGHQANGAFVACGPPGFTALALLKLGAHAREILPRFGLVSEIAGEVWYASSVLGAVCLFGLAVFFFFFGLLPYPFKVHKHLSEILGCWALTFPNVGWIATLRILGDVFELKWFYVIHIVLVSLMCLVWITLFVLTSYAFYRGKIFLANPEDVMRDKLGLPDSISAAAKVDSEKAASAPQGH